LQENSGKPEIFIELSIAGLKKQITLWRSLKDLLNKKQRTDNPKK
jgi:hypothetical protein